MSYRRDKGREKAILFDEHRSINRLGRDKILLHLNVFWGSAKPFLKVEVKD